MNQEIVYQGKGNHSVNTLETIIEQLLEKNSQLQLNIQSLPSKDVVEPTDREIIKYIEQAEVAIPIEKFFKEGKHITKNEYGKILIEELCKDLKERFKPTNSVSIGGVEKDKYLNTLSSLEDFVSNNCGHENMAEWNSKIQKEINAIKTFIKQTTPSKISIGEIEKMAKEMLDSVFRDESFEDAERELTTKPYRVVIKAMTDFAKSILASDTGE